MNPFAKKGMRFFLTLLTGYIAATAFFISFFAINSIASFFGFAGAISEVTALILSLVAVVPIALPFLLPRISRLKIGGFEVDLHELAPRTSLSLSTELEDVERLRVGTSAVPNLVDIIANAVRESETSQLAEVEFGSRTWISSRLYLLAALAEEYTSIRQIILFDVRPDGTRRCLGSITPFEMRRALEAKDAALAGAFNRARNLPANVAETDPPEKSVAWTALNFVQQLSFIGGEDQHSFRIAPDMLGGYFTRITSPIQWEGPAVSEWLVSTILHREEPFVAVTNQSGVVRFIVDRAGLALRVARQMLAKKMEESR